MRELPLAFLGGWEVVRAADSFLHVLPKNDTLPHTCSFECACRPHRDDVCGVVVVHNAADHRERFESKEVM